VSAARWHAVAPATALDFTHARLALPHSPTPPPLHRLASSSRARALAFATAPARALIEVDLPGHHRSPLATASHPEHWLHLTHPMLALASRGKAPVSGNRSPKHGRAHRRSSAPWTPLSTSPFSFMLRTFPSPQLLGARAPLLVPSLGRRLGRRALALLSCASAAAPPLPPVSPYRCSPGLVS
jgi:hypothetical protein